MNLPFLSLFFLTENSTLCMIQYDPSLFLFNAKKKKKKKHTLKSHSWVFVVSFISKGTSITFDFSGADILSSIKTVQSFLAWCKGIKTF